MEVRSDPIEAAKSNLFDTVMSERGPRLFQVRVDTKTFAVPATYQSFDQAGNLSALTTFFPRIEIGNIFTIAAIDPGPVALAVS